MAHYVLEYAYRDMEARARVRPRHLEYITGLGAEGAVVMAGPFADGTGAMVVYDAPSEDAVRRLIEQDPYTIEGVTAERSLREWNVVIPAG